MKINVAALKNNPGYSLEQTFQEEYPDFDLGGEQVQFKQPVKVKVKLTSIGKVLLLKGSIESLLAFKCSCCLKPITHDIQTIFEEECCHVEDLDELGLNQGDEGLEDRYLIYEGDVIDLQPIVMENIIWSLPMKPVCQVDCRGLCPQCGRDLNLEPCQCQEIKIDPRLEVLRKLLTE
ncbi:MAG: DUF177 domain-containing protein [Firmicutes bacterium]|nr:DUF177 domain-containing protein [Bacillota bacterium]